MRRLPLAVLAIAAGLALAGCVPEPAPSGSPTVPVPTGPATSDPTPKPPAPEPTETPQPAEPVSIPCETLATPEAVYAFNPNFGGIGPWTPDAGTPAAEAVSLGGTACRWVNQTSGAPLDVSVAHPGTARLAELRAEAAAGSPAGFGDESFSATVGGSGRVTTFQDGFWIVVSSPYIGQASDAEPIVTSALAALP